MVFTIGSDTTTGFHVYLSTFGSAATNQQLIDLTNAAASAWANNMLIHQHPTTILTHVRATDLSSDTGGDELLATAGAGVGTGGMLPANACYLVNMTVNRRYRGGKPRAYIPIGLDTDLQDPQTWKPASLTSMNTAWLNWIGAVIASLRVGHPGADQVNVSYYKGHKWVPDGNDGYIKKPLLREVPQVDLITSSTGNTRLGSQRRRVRSRS